MKSLALYHGSQNIIERPEFGAGKLHNDYGRGFYCTENLDLAKEWACGESGDGVANRYRLNLDGIRIMTLTADGGMHILNWLAVLIQNRTFQLSGDLAAEAKEYLEAHFLPDLEPYDVIRGYRADDSYFSFATSFLSGALSLEQLGRAMHLGKLSEQVMIRSQNAFDRLEFLGYETANRSEFYPLRMARDLQARTSYRAERARPRLEDAIYMLDILRESWGNDDPRLR